MTCHIFKDQFSQKIQVFLKITIHTTKTRLYSFYKNKYPSFANNFRNLSSRLTLQRIAQKVSNDKFANINLNKCISVKYER